MSAWLACALVFMQVPKELGAFVGKPDPSFSWKEVKASAGLAELSLVSQTWQTVRWEHSLVALNLSKKCDTLLLYVTGDRVDRADLPFLGLLAESSGMPVAGLFDVPNQPIFDQREDALIAYTFGKFLETTDAAWPLLFPMTKSVIRAMDALQKWNPKIEHFVLAGASKRGWTTWLAAATGDKRIAGIAPMVFDFLNFESQLKHQLDSWGKYSEMLGDYVARDQPKAVATPDGKRLAAMVDPHSYLARITVPKLIVLGANDRYWTSDAHSLYLPQLKGNTFFRIVPNVGHNLGNGKDAASAIGFFAKGVSGRLKKSNQAWFDKGVVPKQEAVNWVAGAGSRDFRDSRWSQNAPHAPWLASFQEWKLTDGEHEASFTSPVKVSRSKN